VSKIIKESTSLVDSAIGPVAVTTQEFEGYDVDDYVRSATQSKAEYLRILNKASTVNTLDAEDRPPVDLDDIKIGGFDAP
jgi:hypothetical protein